MHYNDKIFLVEQLGGAEKLMDMLPTVQLPSTKELDGKVKEINIWWASTMVV